MASYLVTGGAGFIGNTIVRELVSRGEQVRVLDNFSTGNRANLLPVQEQVEIVEGDIRDYKLIHEAVQGIDFILHQAAMVSVPGSVSDPITNHEVNSTGTLHLLEAARQAGVKRLVLASSCAVYGNNPELPKRETMMAEPLSPYAVSKLNGEQYCQVFWQLYGFETVCLRYFNVFGPRQDPASPYAAAIPLFIKLLLQRKVPVIYGDGQQSRDFVFVTDVAQANLRACTAPGVAGEIFNVAGGQPYTILEVVKLLSEIMDHPFEVNHAPPRAGDVLHSEADVTQARLRLGYEAQVDFASGLARTVEWLAGNE